MSRDPNHNGYGEGQGQPCGRCSATGMTSKEVARLGSDGKMTTVIDVVLCDMCGGNRWLYGTGRS